MNNQEIEQRDEWQSRRKLAFQKNADPTLVEPFLDQFTGKFLAAPEERSAYYICGPGMVKPYGETIDYQGVSARFWTITGPSNAYPNVPIYSRGGIQSSHLAGEFVYPLRNGRYEVIELPADLTEAVDNIKNASAEETINPDQRLLLALYLPIRRLIDQIHDEYWKDKLIAYDDILVMSSGYVPTTIQRTWYLQPPTKATETVDHILYFATIQYVDSDGSKQSLRAVEKNIIVHSQEERDKYGTALNSPAEMVRKQQFMQARGIPTYEWAYANTSDTRLFVPDLTENECEALDHRVFTANIHPEEYYSERLSGLTVPIWATEQAQDIDQQSERIVDQSEAAGMDLLRDCLYIIKRKGDYQARVIVGDLGQGLFLPDDPNKGKKELRYTL